MPSWASRTIPMRQCLRRLPPSRARLAMARARADKARAKVGGFASRRRRRPAPYQGRRRGAAARRRREQASIEAEGARLAAAHAEKERIAELWRRGSPSGARLVGVDWTSTPS